MVVVPEPAVKCPRALHARAIAGAVGPAPEQRADEALGLAVGLRPVGAGAAVADPEPAVVVDADVDVLVADVVAALASRSVRVGLCRRRRSLPKARLPAPPSIR